MGPQSVGGHLQSKRAVSARQGVCRAASRALLRGWIALACIAAPGDAGAQEFAAPAGRWPDARGTASGSYASRALPLIGDVEEAWKLALPGGAAGAPVHWDGIAYLICVDGTRRALLAVDLASGKVRATKALPPGPAHPALVWDRLVLVRVTESQIMGYSLGGSSFEQRWKPDTGSLPIGEPVVADSEVYFVAEGSLLRLRFGKSRSEVVASGNFLGRPALCGNLVLALCHAESPGYAPSLHISAFDRRTGRHEATSNVAWYAGGEMPTLDAGGAITVTPGEICVEAPAPLKTTEGQSSHAFLSCRIERDRIAFTGSAGMHDLLAPPSCHAGGTLALSGGQPARWHLWARNKEGQMMGTVLADGADRPDLLRHPLPATVLGDIAYFGSWAADLRTGEILWYLPVTDPKFAAVPADGLVLIVDGRTLRAFREAGGS